MSNTKRHTPKSSVVLNNETLNSDRAKKKAFKKQAKKAVRLATSIPNGSAYKRTCDPRGVSDRIESPCARHAG